MPERSSAPSARPMRSDDQSPVPPPDIADFIRFCHRKRRVGWPEIYDEMCAVAARREFKDWDHDELARRGLTFALFDMPTLSGWVRATLPRAEDAPDKPVGPSATSAPQPVPG